MQYSIIFDEVLLEKKIEEIRLNLTSPLFEKELTSNLRRTYSKNILQPLDSYLEESFNKGLVGKGKKFLTDFTKGAKEIATKISKSIKEFSFEKLKLTLTKKLHKLKTKFLKSLMLLLEPLREVIVKNGFCDEENKFSLKATLNSLISLSKSVGKEDGIDKVLTPDIVGAIDSKLSGSIKEGLVVEDEDEERWEGKATFDEKDVKYLDFFQKLLYKMGVKGTKLNGFLSEIAKKLTMGAAITGVIGIISALLPSAGIISGIAAAAGAAIAAAPVLVMVIGSILFGIGLFMFATWLLQPYPTIQNCRIFLSTIFSGANPFDYPEIELGNIETVPMDKVVGKFKPPFDFELAIELEREGVEEDIPGGSNDEDIIEELKDIVADYDDLDIDTLEDDKEVEANMRIARIFVRNIFTQKGRDKIQDAIEDIKEDEEDNDYTTLLEDFLALIDNVYNGDAIKEKEDGKRVYPYALDSEKIKSFLRDKKNSVGDRMSKIIDVTDNFIDRIDKAKKPISKTK